VVLLVLVSSVWSTTPSYNFYENTECGGDPFITFPEGVCDPHYAISSGMFHRDFTSIECFAGSYCELSSSPTCSPDDAAPLAITQTCIQCLLIFNGTKCPSCNCDACDN